jgi:DNA-directed RNA polymerase specialized sigma24 family protein
MSLKAEIAPQLPFLRRYARALTGSQMLGDQAVRDVLEALSAAPEQFDDAVDPREELFRLFHQHILDRLLDYHQHRFLHHL